MKILPPTLRESNRYIAFSLVAEDPNSRRDLINAIQFSAATLLGDVGSSELGIRVMAFEDNKGLIRCAADRVWESRAVLASVSSIKGSRTGVMVLGISGTVHGATEKYLLTKNKTDAGLESEITIELKKSRIVIDKCIVFGSIVNQDNDDIDLLPEDSKYKEILNRSNTKYLGITVFDLKNKEID